MSTTPGRPRRPPNPSRRKRELVTEVISLVSPSSPALQDMAAWRLPDLEEAVQSLRAALRHKALPGDEFRVTPNT